MCFNQDSFDKTGTLQVALYVMKKRMCIFLLSSIVHHGIQTRTQSCAECISMLHIMVELVQMFAV